MSLLPVAMSICVSFISAILILGAPAEMYMYGTQYWITWIGLSLASLLAGLIFVPLLYPLNLTSSYEVFLKSNLFHINIFDLHACIVYIIAMTMMTVNSFLQYLGLRFNSKIARVMGSLLLITSQVLLEH